MPESAFTTPFRLVGSIARQRFPVLQPEPTMARLTTGLINGSRRPAKLIFLGPSGFASAGFFWFSTAICCWGCDFLCPAGAFALLTTGLAEILETTGALAFVGV